MAESYLDQSELSVCMLHVISASLCAFGDELLSVCSIRCGCSAYSV